MDRAYEDDKTRELAVKQGFVPIVPPKRNRKKPWEYDKELYKRRNEVERYFLRIKRFRRVFTRYDKLDALYLGNLTLAMIFDAILMWTGSSGTEDTLIISNFKWGQATYTFEFADGAIATINKDTWELEFIKLPDPIENNAESVLIDDTSEIDDMAESKTLEKLNDY